MAVRNEVVRLSLEDNFSAGMANAAAATALFNRRLTTLNTRLNTVGNNQNARNLGPMAPLVQGLNQVTPASNRANQSINQLSGRLELFAKLGAALGPGLVPIGAVAVPAVTGLANAFGAAALAGGTAILAFQGVGDALTAVNDAALEPSAANLQEAEAALRQLSPAAQELVLRLQDLRPAFESLRDTGASGLFPGVLDAIDSVETRLPEVERIIARVSTTVGGLISEAGDSLASSEFDDFFAFLEREVPPTLVTLGQAVGNVTQGLADLWMAFAPLNTDFNNVILDASRSFAEWADNLSQTQGFADFVAYVRQSGPQVAEAVGSIANALIQIVEAAAPVGGPVLASIEAFADAIAAIANSDFGTPIFGALAALSALNLAMKAFAAVKATTIVTNLIASFTGLQGALLASAVAASAAQFGLVGLATFGVSTLLDQMFDVTVSAQEMNTALSDLAAGDVNEQLSNLGVGLDSLGEALSSAVFDDLGSIMPDFMSSTDEIEQLDAALGSLARQNAPEAAAAFDTIRKAADEQGITLDQLLEKFPQYRLALEETGQVDPTDWFGGVRTALEDVGKGLETALADSKAGRGQAVADAIAGIGQEALTAADSASALQAALDALLSPQLNLSEATDAFEGALRGLNDSLAEQTRSLQGFGEGALQNREVIRGLATDLQGIMVAQAEAGAGPRELARSLESGRQKIIDFGIAAGLSRAQLREFLGQIGLTPRLVRTVLQAQGMKEAAADAKQLREDFGSLPKDVRTRIRADGIPQTKAQLDDLDEAVGGLTKKERRILVDLMDQAARNKVNTLEGLLKHLDSQRPTPKGDFDHREADRGIAALNAALTAIGRRTVNPRVSVNPGSSLGTISAIQSGLNSIQSKSVTVTVNRVMRGSAQLGVATGGYISGPGTGTSDSIPAWLSNGEYVIRAASVARYGREFFDRLNAQAYAQGGIVRPQSQTMSVRFSDVNLSGSVDTGAGVALIRGVARAEAQRVVAETERAKDRRIRAGART